MTIYQVDTYVKYLALLHHLDQKGYLWEDGTPLMDVTNDKEWQGHETCIRLNLLTHPCIVSTNSKAYYTKAYPGVPIIGYDPDAYERRFLKSNVLRLLDEWSTQSLSNVQPLKKTVSLLEEAPKVQVPAMFDQWYRSLKKAYLVVETTKLRAIHQISQTNYGSGMTSVRGEEISPYSKLHIWVRQNTMLAITAVVNGYEVIKDKETKYEIVLMEQENDRLLLVQIGEDYDFRPESENEGFWQQTFTEEELADIDPRYLAFKVVAECYQLPTNYL